MKKKIENMEYYQGLKMSEKNLNFSPPATPPMDLSDTNSNNSNDFKVSFKWFFCQTITESFNFQSDVIQSLVNKKKFIIKVTLLAISHV